MPEKLDVLLVYGIVAAAVIYLVWRAYRRVKNHASGCESCDGCCGDAESKHHKKPEKSP